MDIDRFQLPLAEKLSLFDGELPLERASTIPNLWYTDPEIARLEKQKVFGNNWVYVGRTDQISEPGMFFTMDLAGDPIVVSKDKAGGVHAFVNICRHRAARVECRSHGKVSRFRCRYHGWAYDLAGRLVGTPDFENVCDFDKGDHQLPRLNVDTFGPFVFVSFSDSPLPLLEFLSPISDRAEFEGIGFLKFVSRQTYEMDCNWKLFIDNYLDGGYHIPTLHPVLAKVVNMDGYQTHCWEYTNVQESPLKPSNDANLNATRKGDKAFYWWIYPNFMVNLYEGVMDINVVYPVSENKCICIFDFFFLESDSEPASTYIKNSVDIAHKVQLEDMEICHEVQRGLASRFYENGRFSVRREEGGYHFHRLLAADLKR